MKLCTKCKERKPIDEFNKHSKAKDGLQAACKICKSSYYKNRRKEHIEIVRVNRKVLVQRNHEYVAKIKSNPCVDCGQTYHSCIMDFDHVKGDKFKDVSKLVNTSFSLETIQNEINKCDLVCSNCHRMRTYLRLRSTMDSAGAF